MSNNQNDPLNDTSDELYLPVYDKYKDTYHLVREEYSSAINQEMSELDALLPNQQLSQSNKIKYKNLLIEHANRVLATYKHHVKIQHNEEEENVVLLPPDKVLEQTNQIRTNILGKAIQKRRNQPTQKIDFGFNFQVPQKLWTTFNGTKMPVQECLKQFPKEQFEARKRQIKQQQKIIEKAKRSLVSKFYSFKK